MQVEFGLYSQHSKSKKKDDEEIEVEMMMI